MSMTSEVFHDYGNDLQIPFVDVSNIERIPETVKDKFTDTNFAKVIQRNIEREVIPKSAALISVAGRSVPTVSIDNISVRITNQPTGGVTVEYPVNTNAPDTAEITAVKDKPTVLRVLSRADISYNVTPEANIVGDQAATHAEYLQDAREALAARMDNLFIEKLDDSVPTGHTTTLAAAAKWSASTSDPDANLNDAIKKILEDSSLDPNSGDATGGSKWTLILPISAYDVVKQTRVIDNHRLTYEQYLTQKHAVQILWSRKPMGFVGTWELGKNAYLFPTMDRRVGSFYIFSGRAGVPSMYREVNPRGERITMQYWMEYIPGASEETGEYGATNERTYKFGGIVA